MARLLRLLLAAVGFVLYVWIAAVRNLPRVKAKKASRRRRQR
jgi:hypothetical protein